MKTELSAPRLVLSSLMAIIGLTGIAVITFNVFPNIEPLGKLAIFLGSGALFGTGVAIPFRQPLLGALMGATFWYLAIQIYKTITMR